MQDFTEVVSRVNVGGVTRAVNGGEVSDIDRMNAIQLVSGSENQLKQADLSEIESNPVGIVDIDRRSSKAAILFR